MQIERVVTSSNVTESVFLWPIQNMDHELSLAVFFD